MKKLNDSYVDDESKLEILHFFDLSHKPFKNKDDVIKWSNEFRRLLNEI